MYRKKSLGLALISPTKLFTYKSCCFFTSAFISLLSCSFSFFSDSFCCIAIVSICLVCVFHCSRLPSNASCPLCVLFVLYSFCFLLFVGVCLVRQSRTKGEGCSTANYFEAPLISLLAVHRLLFCFHEW